MPQLDTEACRYDPVMAAAGGWVGAKPTPSPPLATWDVATPSGDAVKKTLADPKPCKDCGMTPYMITVPVHLLGEMRYIPPPGKTPCRTCGVYS
jgi:hypothetical protein